MVLIESADGKKKNIKCIGCAIMRKEISCMGGSIYNSKNFEISMDYEIPIPGLFVIGSKRHIIGIADFTKEEREEFFELVYKLRKLMRNKLNIKYVAIVSSEDKIISDRNPSHFHMAFIPRTEPWMKGKNISELLLYAKENMKTEKNLQKVKASAEKMKKSF